MTMRTLVVIVTCWWVQGCLCRDEDKILKACYWPNEVYEPCFGGCAEVSCDNPRNHLRPCYPYCEPGCICEDPYVRDDRTHQCVLPQDCSPTQMGIPVPSRRGNSKLSLGKYDRSLRNHKRNDILPPTLDLPPSDNEDLPPPPPPPPPPLPPPPLPIARSEDFKRASEVSRMGNYFNIVIAPPPIKALQPRKLLQPNDGFRSAQKRIQ